MTDQAITILVGAAMVVGLIGTAVPWFPDTVLMWGAGLAYGLTVGWGTWGGWLFGLMTLIALAALIAEVGLSAAGARLGGASGCAIGVGLLAAVVGLLLFSPLGALLAFVAGILVAEWVRIRNPQRALRATGGAVLGWGASFIFKFGLGALMITLWGIWVVTG
ncbi:MAG TPA: DUF456 domain-containing protein [Anaerolineales bacterium]|nr:DUF456 domain-containing protein [Anaerolineales bacterium]